MRLVDAAFATAALAASALPAAASERISNADYIKAVRCQELASNALLGSLDTRAIDSFVRNQKSARDPKTERMARSSRRAVQHQIENGDVSKLLAERDQACAAWIAPAQVANRGRAS